MRVAHLVPSLHPDEPENGILDLAGAAPAAGLELVVVAIATTALSPVPGRLRALGVPVVELGTAPWDPRSLPRLVDVLRRHRVDLLHTHVGNADTLGGLAGARLRMPVVSTVHRIESQPADASDRAKRAAKILARRRFVTRTIAISQLQRDWYAGAAADLVVLPNGVGDPGHGDATARERLRERLGVAADGVLVASVAPMRRGMGQDLLLDAVAALSDSSPVTVVLGGDGPLRPWLQARVDRDDELASRIVFHPTGDPLDLLRAADVMVHTTRSDAMPRRLVEGLALGLPAVASTTGGIPEIVTRDTGVLVALDAGRIAAALDALAADPDRRARLGAAARQRFLDRFEAGRWAAELRGIYAGLLESGTATLSRR
ncbi:glycosyltransferase family 4 protein [Pseudonocardia dioxanivorans]|uniref:glycosyltransferase family 4 protein n=1 Tax=Pseudonocardia dioxanivorans TaxID=240495 RepID=UPI000CD1F736|nr:glycosyltransferase family 4 protein [Pseudonocardia dioxanivorans]